MKVLFQTSSRVTARTFTSSSRLRSSRILDPIRTPPTFHDYLRLSSSNNSLLLALFTTSTCTPCRTITPLLTSLVTSRAAQPADKFSDVRFAEVELDSSDRSNGDMMVELGVVYGVSSLPSLMAFGGRRAERLGERVTDTAMLRDRARMERWVDELMKQGDPFPTGGAGATGDGKGLMQRMFG